MKAGNMQIAMRLNLRTKHERWLQKLGFYGISVLILLIFSVETLNKLNDIGVEN